MKISKWGIVTAVLATVLIYNTYSYAASDNDTKVKKCYNRIDKMEKGLDKQDAHINDKKRQWARKARIYWADAKKAAENNDGNSCTDLLNKAKSMKKYGYG